MEMEFKPDFEDAKDRWTAFWKGENLGRPLVSIVLPQTDVEPVAKPSPVACVHDDYEAAIEQVLRWAETHEFVAEAIPFYRVQFGPDHFSALLGADLEFSPDSPDTSWCVPFVEDWDDAEIKFQPDGKWWEKTVERIRAFRARCDGKLLVCGPNLQSGLDCLSAIRGPEKLLMDVVTVPDKVKAALDAVCRAYDEALAALSVETGVEEFGDITRHQMYCRGKIGIPQCDFSCMISPEMFREFEVSCLEREVKPLAAATYHLDGPDAIVHLPAICEIDGIDVIQWQPGAGEAVEKDWTDLYKRIDSLGKGQVLGGGGVLTSDHEYLKGLWRELDSRKLFFVTSASSVKQANEFLEDLEKLA
jgi:5-methyltetrahydrofolate--homocysteine methyltransferase